MKRSILGCVIATAFAVTLAFGSTAVALNFEDVIIEYWAGTGSNEALLIIDFDENSTNDSYAFGYRFDGTETGEDMIKAVDAAGDLNVTDFGGTGESYFLSDIAYLGNERGALSTGEYWSYWRAQGEPFPGWSSSGYGAGNPNSALGDGSWDGWSVPFGGPPNYDPPPPPDIPTPIPGAVWLFGSGLLGLLGIGRKKS